MSLKQMLLLVIGGAAIILSFLFPVVRYSINKHELRDGEMMKMKFRGQIAFAFPVWNLNAAPAEQSETTITDAKMMWPYTIIRAVAIAACVGCIFVVLPRPRKKVPSADAVPNPSASSPGQ